MSQQNLLRYIDRNDRLYGIAGMTVGLFIFDAEQYIDHLDTSATDLEAVVFTPDFFICPVSSVSAKSVWKSLLGRYKVITAMVMGNLVCRATAGSRSAIEPATLNRALEILVDEGDDILGLTPTECREVAMESYNYMRRAFNHPAIIEFINQLHSTLSSTDEIGRSELFELLAPLR